MDFANDPTVADYRARISAIDEELLEAINRRATLVSELHAHKRSNDYPLRDHGREEALLAALTQRNPGPLSDHRLEELFRLVLAICTTEAATAAGDAAS
ncbi:MAG: Chorismate mutase type [Gaiellales bacterium]|jgi:chorismate mutase|nr:Chorismate mutase type [Gaiellales bacterium]